MIQIEVVKKVGKEVVKLLAFFGSFAGKASGWMWIIRGDRGENLLVGEEYLVAILQVGIEGVGDDGWFVEVVKDIVALGHGIFSAKDKYL